MPPLQKSVTAAFKGASRRSAHQRLQCWVNAFRFHAQLHADGHAQHYVKRKMVDPIKITVIFYPSLQRNNTIGSHI